MKQTIFIIVGCILAALVGFSVFLWWQNASEEPSPELPPPQGFPEIPESQGVEPPEGKTSIGAVTGSRIVVDDFRTSPNVIEDPVNPGYYVVEPADKSFMITYIADTEYFNVSLFAEPLGEVRQRAEQYLASHLGVPVLTLCVLKYTVSVPYYVNEAYSSIDLRLGSCPESVVLPQ